MAKKVGKKYIPDDVVKEDLAELDRLVRQIRAGYNQFFVGASQMPPDFKVAQVRKILKRYQGGELIRRPVDRYRFYNFQSRFNANMELWGRKIKQMEGQNVFGRQGGAAKPPVVARQEEESAAARAQRKAATQGGFRYSAVSKDPSAESATVEGLLGQFQEAHKRAGKNAPSFTKEKFQSFLKKQADNVRLKKQCDAVKFTVKVVDGDVKFSVRPVKKS